MTSHTICWLRYGNYQKLSLKLATCRSLNKKKKRSSFLEIPKELRETITKLIIKINSQLPLNSAKTANGCKCIFAIASVTHP